MPKPVCLICKSPHRGEIEAKMLNHPTPSTIKKLEALSKRITKGGIEKHMKNCLGKLSSPRVNPTVPRPSDIIEDLGARSSVNAELVLAEQRFREVNAPLDNLKIESSKIRVQALSRGLLNTALMAIDREARLIELQVKVASEMRAQEMHNELLQKKDWAKTQQFIWRFMEEYDLTKEFWDGLASISSS